MRDVPSGDSKLWFFRFADVPRLRAGIVRGLDRGVKPVEKGRRHVGHHRLRGIQSAVLWWFAVLFTEVHNAMVCTRTRTWSEYVPAETSGDPALGEHLPRGT